jgi:carboxymethylenebutenolidase
MPMIEVPVPGGTAEAWLSRPIDSSRPAPGVLFLMDAIGLRPQIFTMADRIASWGYVVLAPNVFWRSGTVEEVAPKGDLREPGERQKFFRSAGPRIRALTPERALPDLAAYVTALRGQPGVDDGPIGTVGYCMGARLAVRAAGAHPDVVAAAAGFHGGGLVTDDEHSPHRSLATARAEFVFGHADQDPGMTSEDVETLGRALDEAGLTATNEVYPGAGHGYTMADTAVYDEDAAERSFRELHALLDRTLGAGRAG